MNIIDHGAWEPYTPEELPYGSPPNALFVRRVSDHVDWYVYANGPGVIKSKAEVQAAAQEAANPKGPQKDASETPAPKEPPPKPNLQSVNFQPGSVVFSANIHSGINKYVIGPVNRDVTALHPADQVVGEITDYTGTDPFKDLNGSIYDPAAGTITPLVLPKLLSRAIIVERLNADKKIDKLAAYLSSHPYEHEWWYAKQTFAETDKTLKKLLKEIGADLDVVLAEAPPSPDPRFT